MFINTAEEVSGIPASWPRVDLSGRIDGRKKVRQIQEQPARISRPSPAIPTITPDGIYGPATREAVERFQSLRTSGHGVIDFRTWYRISEIYVAVTRIADWFRGWFFPVCDRISYKLGTFLENFMAKLQDDNTV